MANVLHRTTKEYRESVHTPDYAPATWILNPDLSGVAGVPAKYWKINGDEVTEMSAEDKTIVDAANLGAYKAARVVVIDAKTSELILDGFSFDDSNFSMSEAAQRNWAGLGSIFALGLLTFPVPISTADAGEYIVTDQANCLQFLQECMLYQTHVDYPLATGRALKAAVEAATTEAEVDAVEDTR